MEANIFFSILFTILGVFYFTPTLIALRRPSIRLVGVFLINLLLGWTLLFWVVALALALKPKEPEPVVI